MDNIISAALEEVCVRGSSGICLLELWSSLQKTVSSFGLELSDTVKKVIWCRLTLNPCLQFMISGSFVEHDILLQSVEKLEKLELNIVAKEHLMDSFMGLYDLKQAPHFEISNIQRRVLERLAMARSSGITQNELAKEFDIKGTNFFYVVRNLECQKLIVRQTTIVREKESLNAKKGPKGDHIVNTNLLRLSRFAKDVNPQQRIEITRSVWPEMLDESGDTEPYAPLEVSEDYFREDVHINDYIPAMKAICEKLEAANNKVDVVSGIKSALGYRKTTGHRAWRSILNRLKYWGLVEEFQAKIKGKDVTCLRLLKKFDSTNVQRRVFLDRYNSTNSENLVNCRKKGQITEQLVVIPLEQQIYDMIDAAGQKGITILELSTRLGINLKKLHKRVFLMRDKYGLVSESEIHNKTQAYRFWSNSLRRTELSKSSSQSGSSLINGYGLSAQSCALVPLGCPVDSVSKGGLEVEKTCIGQALEMQNPNSSNLTAELCEREQEPHERALKSNIGDCDINFDEANYVPELHESSSYQSSSVSPIQVLPNKKYACRSSTVFAALREQRILAILENEKFVLKVELHKLLEDVEKDKPRTMDRKTLDRSLKKLQDAGSCLCIGVYMPSLTNFNSLRYAEAIVHPSVHPSQELLQNIYEKQRFFDIQSRRSTTSARLNPQSPVAQIAELNNVKKAPNSVDDMPAMKAMTANGFVLAKMVRAKLLHKFLWSSFCSYPQVQNALSSFKKFGSDTLNLEDSGQLFSIDSAIKEMPLELFLQVVGSRLIIDNLVKRCKLGLRLSDIPMQERSCLLDNQATIRLSSVVEILHRLKLIQLVNKGAVQDVNLLSYGLELHPYLEEPVPTVLPFSDINISDNCYKLRHDFNLLDKDAIDRYWETLEYCFAGADPAYSRQCFPGSTVEEVFYPRSWASIRVMTIEQRINLLKGIEAFDQTKKIPFNECVKLSRELNLTLEQVLRASNDKRQGRLTESSYLKSEKRGQRDNTNISEVDSIKRRRLSTDVSHNDPQALHIPGDLIGGTKKTSCGTDEQPLHLDSCSPSEIEEAGALLSCRAGEQNVTAAHSQSNEDVIKTAAFISQCARDELNSTCKKRFFWTDSSDRQLIMLYARHRAMLGARFFRVEWPSLCDLPANPGSCKRRMTILNQNPNVRRAILRLCGLLGERYSSYLDKSRKMANQEPVDNDLGKSNEKIILHKEFQNQHTRRLCKSNSQHYYWDDFEASEIKLALDEVIKCKRLDKVDDAKSVGFKPQNRWSNKTLTDNLICSHQSERHNNSSHDGGVVHNCDKKVPKSTTIDHTVTQSRSNNTSSCQKVLKFRGKSNLSELCESLPIANAIELLKLVFLSSSKAPGVQNSLAKTLQKYHHGDIFAAFCYLRENNYLAIGHGTRPFVLSRKFFHNMFSSPFPINSGKRANMFSDWLKKQENGLIDGVAVAPDLQCGEIFHLSALVFSGEISVSPSLPHAGVDGTDGFNSSGVLALLAHIDDINPSKNSKRKADVPCSSEKVKKPMLQAKADGDRKEKGFPDIKIFMKMESVAGADSFDCSGYGKFHIDDLEGDTTSVKDAYCLTSTENNVVVYHDIDSLSFWDAMSRHFELLASTSPIKNKAKPYGTVFKSVHLLINQAGEQGLSMAEISDALKIKGEGVADMFVETLEAFRLTVKVNAFDSIRVVDTSFIPKYFISVLRNEKAQYHGCDTLCTGPQGLRPSKGISSNQLYNINYFQNDVRVALCTGNKASGTGMPNISNQDCEFYAETQVSGKGTIIEEKSKSEKSFPMQDNGITGMQNVFQPILPWINGDGSTNLNVYRGLSRRILGIIMQNPYILEEDIITKMDVLNPQSCRTLLETMVRKNHIMTRWVHQTSCVASPPRLLQKLMPSNLSRPALKLQKHYIANPMCTRML